MGAMTLTNNTLSGNQAEFSGGGIYNEDGRIGLINVSIAYNTADSDGNNVGNGGGICWSGGTITLKSTIVAGNFDLTPKPGTAHPDISGPVVGNANNLIGNITGAGGTIGTGSDIIDSNPKVGPLVDNGGETLTHALLLDSPAIDYVGDCTDLAAV